MEKFLKGKTLYIEDSKDGRTLRFVIANITRCENGVLVTSEENEQIFVGHQCFEDLKNKGGIDNIYTEAIMANMYQ